MSSMLGVHNSHPPLVRYVR